MKIFLHFFKYAFHSTDCFLYSFYTVLPKKNRIFSTSKRIIPITSIHIAWRMVEKDCVENALRLFLRFQKQKQKCEYGAEPLWQQKPTGWCHFIFPAFKAKQKSSQFSPYFTNPIEFWSRKLFFPYSSTSLLVHVCVAEIMSSLRKHSKHTLKNV